MRKLLSENQIADYRRDGYLFPIPVLCRDEAMSYRAEIESLEKTYQEHALGQPLNQFFRTHGHVVIPFMARIAQTKTILDSVQGILGPDLLVWSCELFIKEPNTQKVVSWHQDLTYWGLGETDDLVTAWIALSPATMESGCMKFVAGSHQQRLVAHRDTFHKDNLLSRGQEIAVDVDESESTPVVLKPGEMSLHHGRMFHASGPNVSNDRRIGVAIRYVTPGVRQIVAQRDYAMLVRGCDQHRNWINFAAPDEAFTDDGLTLRSRITTDQAALNAQ
ncbi:phytanoyl-CoA dioxygenase family protein [Mesorhizobium amorphae]|uniref:phytanoyl-CoA dioxygenase family protein n=1 Tax=Mesorhizobium amorphae TaxID=71433 RepID=UPI0024E0615D|nr:phytanoyl-CoA dioxygenase family protein [Mesorhizobium amorphae]